MIKKLKSFSIVALSSLLILTGCGESTKFSKTLTVTDNQFDSQGFHNAVAKIVVENAFDNYTVETSTASSTMNWQSIIAGDIDLDIESWTVNVATYEEDTSAGDIIEIGDLVPDSQQGFYVPRYVIEGDKERGIEPMAPDLKTVEDLKKYPELFPDDEKPGMARIYGGVTGWMIDETLYAKYKYHGLDENFNYFRLGNEASLFASLVSSYNLGEAWVGYCYEPTWIAGKLDLVRLTDAPYDPATYESGASDFPEQSLKIVSSKYFKERHPDLVDFFSKYRTGKNLVNDALAYMDENNSSHEEAAIWFLKNNEDLLDDWLTPEQSQKVKDFISTK